MNSELMFSLSIIVTLVVLMLLVFKSPKAIFEYFKTKDGKGILKGIVLAIVFSLLLVVASVAFSDEGKGEWFAYGKAYVGVDRTDSLSPQCYSGGVDDRLTSNMGVIVNIYRGPDKRYEFNAKYTHHSCVFNKDRFGYDSGGIEFVKYLWGN